MLGSDYVIESNQGIHSLEMEKGVTVPQLHKAIMKTVKDNPKEFKLKANDPNPERSVVWTFSEKYKEQVTFYAMKSEGNVYLSVDIGNVSKADNDIKDIYYLEGLVESNLESD
ncbi:hypothetical protein IB678_05410 [Francisella adeliensis]|uniref:Uncharacterized protein n=1 Tax=Francisella adeliensis TaxID=2007306 RepID=A0A2Z4Y0I6_9GAMM|nr:hypothetical protein CDH04_01625 [Francisella adeliensis]MBK2085082.1 hypothetical protein [Francisella adeliensis]MBK2096927.1 hypothetical protein [Francisella adeliensis]QIW12921.1 hypothetical protein FZC43_01630 [Francisella adeliensis]QIW14800.1 hypothetical protein FZC44_01630 [Francisella adeliensis]